MAHLNLTQFCLSQGREADALRHAEDGLWLFEDDPPDERLVAFAADLHLKAGRIGEAEALLWRAIDKRSSRPLLILAQHRRRRRPRPRPRRFAGTAGPSERCC